MGVPICEEGFRTPDSDASSAAVFIGGAGALVGTGGFGVALATGAVGRIPLLLRAARRSEVLSIGAAATLFWTLFSCAWLAFCSAGTAVRICGVLGFCPFASRACSPFNAPGARIGRAGWLWAAGGCINGAVF